MNIGMQGILVKTGKYLPNIEINSPSTLVADNFYEAVQFIEQTLS